jgi:hypothetical protein
LRSIGETDRRVLLARSGLSLRRVSETDRIVGPERPELRRVSETDRIVGPERPEFANRQYVRQYRWPGAARGCEAFTPDFRLFTSIFCVWRPTSEHRIIERFRSNIKIPPCRLTGLCLPTISLPPMAAVRQGTGWELSYLALNFSIVSVDDRFLWTKIFVSQRFRVRIRLFRCQDLCGFPAG